MHSASGGVCRYASAAIAAMMPLIPNVAVLPGLDAPHEGFCPPPGLSLQHLNPSNGSSVPSTATSCTGLVPASRGSQGHPELCRRPCVLMARGACLNGTACSYCHDRHEDRPPKLDKKQRRLLQEMPPKERMELLLPHIHTRLHETRIQGSGLLFALLATELERARGVQSDADPEDL